MLMLRVFCLSAALLLPAGSSVATDRGAEVSRPAASSAGSFLHTASGKEARKLRLKRQAAQKAEAAAGDGLADDPPPACSCDCCETVARRPGEIAFGAGVKCSPADGHSTDVCGPQCSPGPKDQVLQDEVVDMQRFCFFECKPFTGAKAPEKSQCVALSDDEVSRVVDPDGNALDPAFLYAGAPLAQPLPSYYYGGNSGAVMPGAAAAGASAASAALLASRSHLSNALQLPAEPASPDAVDPEKAKQTATVGKKQAQGRAKTTMEESAKLRDLEDSKSKDLNAALKAAGDGFVIMDPYAAVSGLKAAAMSAKASAQQASVSASEAIKSYGAGRKSLWKLALAEAGKEVQTWKAKAEKKARDEMKARFAETWQMKAAKAAQEASKPYIEALLRAQESVKTYNNQGFAMADQSSKLWKESVKDAEAANKLPRRTIEEENKAKAAIFDAREKAKEAQRLAVEARQSFDTAASVRKSVPQYQYAAQQAAATAVAGMNGPR